MGARAGLIGAVARDGVIYAASAVVSRGLAFLIVPIYSRLLVPDDYAALDLITTLGVLANLVVPLEVAQGMAREWADAPNAASQRRMAGTALWFTTVSYAVFLLVLWPASDALAAHWIGSPTFATALTAGLAFIAANGLFLQLQGQFRWSRRPQGYGVLSVLYAALTLVFGVLGSRANGLTGLLLGQALAAASCAGLAAWRLRGQLAWAFSRTDLAKMLRFSLPLVPSGMSMFLAFYANRVLLSSLVGLQDVAVYSVAARLAGLATLLVVGVQGALTPLIYVHHREPGVPGQLGRLFGAFVALALSLCLALSLFARELVVLAATEAYAGAAALLPWLAPAALLSQMYVFAPGIGIARRTGWQLAVTAAAAAVSLALNALMIPVWGALGAAAANLFASAAFFAAWMVLSQRIYPVPLARVRLLVALGAFGAALVLGEVSEVVAGASWQGWAARIGLLLAFGASLWGLGLWRLAGVSRAVGPADR